MSLGCQREMATAAIQDKERETKMKCVREPSAKIDLKVPGVEPSCLLSVIPRVCSVLSVIPEMTVMAQPPVSIC